MKSIRLWLFILVIVSFPLILPFFKDGFFPTHDGEWAVVRLADMYREIKDGQIPPRFSGNLNFGYGYPLFNYAYPMPYYLGLPLFVAKFGLVNSIKLLFALSVPLSAIGMFFASRAVWGGTLPGVVSALLYIYLPYRMVDLYVRGSLGESLASVLFPILFYLVTVLSRQRSTGISIVLAAVFGALVLTHNIMAVLFFGILAAYVFYLFFTTKRKLWVQIPLSLLGGVALSAFFWLPAIVEKQFVLLSQIPIADRDLYYVNLQQLFLSPWGYGTPTESNPFTYQLGFPHVITTLAAFCFFSFQKKYPQRALGFLFVTLTGVCILLLFNFSSFIWERTPILSEINYPWTLLFPIGFLMCLLAGSLMRAEKMTKLFITLMVFFAIVTVLPFAKPSGYVNRGDGYYFTNDATTTSSRELMPLWVKQMPLSRPEQKIEIREGDGNIHDVHVTSDKITFSADLREESIIRLNTIYFPNWRWYKGEDPIAFTYDNPQGVMEASLDKGEHRITVVLENTPIRTLANMTSGTALIALLGILIVSIGKKKMIAG